MTTRRLVSYLMMRLEIMNNLAEQIIVDVLKERMALTDKQIWVRSQNRKIPVDTKLYIIVGLISAQTYSAQTYMETKIIDGEEKQYEVNKVNTIENIQIDILSRSNDAITRRWEIIAALNSIYAKQKQEANYFKISRVPASFIETSSAEGSSQLNRFSITFPCWVWYKKETELSENNDYYDDFSNRVDDAKTIGNEDGLIEFRIQGNAWVDSDDWDETESWMN